MPNLLVDRATSDMLIGPDWALNLEICDILNHNPGLAKDFVKGLKKRIRSKNSNVQLLALTLLETVVKNCGDIVHMHIADKGIPHAMVKIVKKKPDFHVKEKILGMINSWQEAFVGDSHGRYPQFIIAYHDLLRAGVVFPKRHERSTAPPFTPPQMKPRSTYSSSLKNCDKQSKMLEYDNKFQTLSLEEIQNARSIMDVLVEMLNVAESGAKQDVKQEVVVDLVEQCRLYRQRVVHLVNSTSDEELLCDGLSLNDDLQSILAKYDALAVEIAKQPPKKKSLQALVDIDDHENTNQDDCIESDRRSSAAGSKTTQSPLPHVDLLSGEDFGAASSEKALVLVPSNEPNSAASAISEQNMLDLTVFSPDNSGNINKSAENKEFLAEEFSFPAASLLHIQQQQLQQSLPHFPLSLESAHGHGTYVILSNDGAIDQDGALPPPPWETALQDSGPPLTFQPQPSKHLGETSPCSPRTQESPHGDMHHHGIIRGSQPIEMYHPHHHNNQMASYVYGHELAQRMYGISMHDHASMNDWPSHHQLPSSSSSSSSSSYWLQPRQPLKPEDSLFGDLVSMAKSKQNKPANYDR